MIQLYLYHSVSIYSELDKLLFSLSFSNLFHLHFTVISTNSLNFHEITVKVIYFTKFDAITYPLILQYCRTPNVPLRRIDLLVPCNTRDIFAYVLNLG